MKTLHLTAIIAGVVFVIIAIFFITIPKPTHLPGVYEYIVTDYTPDTNKTWGTDVIQNQTFHFDDYNMSDSLPKPYWVDMYDTNFTFPNGLQASFTPGGAIFETYVTFPNETVPYRMAVTLGRDVDHKAVTVLSTHKDPQAGYTIYGNTLRLLVNWPKIHSNISLVGFNDTYKTGQPIDFQIKANGFDYLDRAETPEFYVKGSDGTIVLNSSSTNGLRLCCPQELVNYDRTFDIASLGGPVTIYKVGLYDLVASYNHQQITKQFSVITSHDTSIFDTGIYPFSINVRNTNFTLDYNISRNNKLLDANMDSQSKSLILSLDSTSKGMMTISISRELLDSKSAYSNQDTRFIILVDKQEVKYSETTSITTRTLTIPFELGAKKIEITSTVGI